MFGIVLQYRQAGKRWPVRYGTAVIAIVFATFLRLGLNPVVGDTAVPFITYFPAVLFSAWHGGFRVGAVSILLSAIAADYYFVPPVNTFHIPQPGDQITLLIFVVVGFGIALLSHSQRRALERAARAEFAERTERQRFETTLASIGDAVIATDTDGRVIFINAVAESLTGWKREEALGKPLQNVFRITNEETREPVDNPAARALREGRIVGLANHTVLITRNGTEIPIDDSGSPIKDPAGNTVGAILIFRDITQRRRLEAERERASRAAHRLAAIVESSDDAIISTDFELRITSWNLAAEKMFGHSVSEAIGQSIRLILPEDRWEEEDLILGRIRNRQEVKHFETQRLRKNSTLVSVSVSASPIYDLDGAVIGTSKILRDITERKQAEERLRLAVEVDSRARRAAEDANRAKDEFLAMLSHELRNPLSSILGWAVILRTGELPLERAGHALEVIERNARMEARLVESLLDLSRIAAGKLKLDREQVDLSPALKNVVDSTRPAADAKSLRIDLVLPDELIVVRGDSSRLQQIFSNLVSNAVKFTPLGGRIDVRLQRIGSRAQIQVIDSGEGINAEFLPHIFDRFRQAETAKSRVHGGLGLGLAIVRELVYAHGGTVAADSEGKGRGSTFTVTLPIPAVTSPHKPPSIQTAVGEEPSISEVRILVVDDDEDARELLAVTLGSRGAVVQTASSATEALERIRELRPDIMIADIGMPHQDGYELIKTLRTTEQHDGETRLPAIALTAYASAADHDFALKLGYDAHMAKPVGPTDLAQAVARLLQRLF